MPVWAGALPSLLGSPEVPLSPITRLPKGRPLVKRTPMGDMYGSMELCQQFQKNSQSECLSAKWASLTLCMKHFFIVTLLWLLLIDVVMTYDLFKPKMEPV